MECTQSEPSFVNSSNADDLPLLLLPHGLHPHVCLFFFIPASYEQQNKMEGNKSNRAFLSLCVSSRLQRQIPEARPTDSIPEKWNHLSAVYLPSQIARLGPLKAKQRKQI
jgi:hypothetical protein